MAVQMEIERERESDCCVCLKENSFIQWPKYGSFIFTKVYNSIIIAFFSSRQTTVPINVLMHSINLTFSISSISKSRD